MADYYLVDYCTATTDPARQAELATDASVVINRMFAAMAAQNVLGPTVHLPPWEMKMANPVSGWIQGTIFQGQGYSEVALVNHEQSRFYRDNQTFCPFYLTNTLNGGGFRDILFHEYQDDPNGSSFTARDYQPWIVSVSSGHEFRRLSFWNCSRWLKFGDGPNGSGRMFVRDVTGHPLVLGIDIEYATDVVHLHGIHMQRYFGSDSVNAWCQANAIGIRSARNDNPIFEDIFILGCHRGLQIDLHTGNGQGTTTGIQATDVCMDTCTVGVLVNTSGTVVNCFTNLRIQPGPASIPNSRAIEFAAGVNGCDFYLANFVSDQTNLESIYIPGTNNALSLVNPRIGTWDDQNAGHYAINASAGNFVKVDNVTFVSSSARYYTGGATWIGVYATGSGGYTADASGTITVPLNLGGLTPSRFFGEVLNGYPFVLTRAGVSANTYQAKVWNANTVSTPAGSYVQLAFRAEA